MSLAQTSFGEEASLEALTISSINAKNLLSAEAVSSVDILLRCAARNELERRIERETWRLERPPVKERVSEKSMYLCPPAPGVPCSEKKSRASSFTIASLSAVSSGAIDSSMFYIWNGFQVKFLFEDTNVK